MPLVVHNEFKHDFTRKLFIIMNTFVEFTDSPNKAVINPISRLVSTFKCLFPVVVTCLD